MNGSHIFAVNVLLGSRNTWPPSHGGQARDDSGVAELDLQQDDQPPHAPARPKNAWTRVWQRVSCLLD